MPAGTRLGTAGLGSTCEKTIDIRRYAIFWSVLWFALKKRMGPSFLTKLIRGPEPKFVP
jgi:hypothetical protein